MNEGRIAGLGCAATLLVLGTASVAAFGASGQGRAADPGLQAFTTWLDRTHPHYGCDQGPAAFHNSSVAAAYPGRRFYYALTRRAASSRPSPTRSPWWPRWTKTARCGASIRSMRIAVGLVKVSSSKQAKLAAAAVLILSLADPGEGRSKFDPAQIKAKQSGKGWTCDYGPMEGSYTSHVTFDKRGLLSAMEVNTAPVPVRETDREQGPSMPALDPLHPRP